MARRGLTHVDKFEENCNLVRLQLIYLDDVNDAGCELTKLYRQTELFVGLK